MRSRASSLPLLCWRSTARGAPACRACSLRWRRSSSFSSMALPVTRAKLPPGPAGLPPATCQAGRVPLPISPPLLPMLAKLQGEIPVGQGWLYEPQWDGFRCIVFRDGDEVELASRNTKPLTRYFPEVVAAIKEQLPERCVLDGELFVAVGDRLEFETLQERIHPAASRVNLLAEQTPAGFVA